MPDEVVGRGVELAAVQRFVERTDEDPRALVLEGEAGIGKSTLWEAGIEAARGGGRIVLTARPARAEQELTLGGLIDLLGGVDDDVLARLPQPQRHALEVALLRASGPGTAPDQRALSVAVAAVLRILAASAPILLAIDDAQWLDESSAAVVTYAVRRLAGRRIGLLLSMRSGSATPAWDHLIDAVPAERVERLRLEPLALGPLHRLVERRVGRAFPRLVLVRIEAASGGNPLHALEVARELVRSGLPVTPGEPLPVPESLGSLIAARVGRLEATTRRALLLAAAAVEPTMPTLRAAGISEADLERAADEGLIVRGHDPVRFVHPLFAQAVVGIAAPEDLREAHALLASATPSADARARHLARAAVGPDESVALELERAAARARDRGASLDAAALYQESAALTPLDDADVRLRRSVLAAECLFVDLSEIVQADAILEAALADTAASGPVRAEALSQRALLRYYHGRVLEAVELGGRALDEAGDDPIVRATVLGRAAFATMQLDLAAGVALVDEAASLLETAAAPIDPDLEASILLLRVAGELGLVRPVRTADIERGLRLITASGRSWEHEAADGSAFGIARLMDDLDRAIAMTRDLIRAKSGPTGDDPFNLVQLSGLLCFHGDWAEAREVAEAALAAYEREGEHVHPAWGLRGVALVAAHDGRLDEARRLATEGLARAAERGDVILEIFHRQILGFVALSIGDWRIADRELAEAGALADRIATRHPGRFKLAGDHVEAALALGQVDRAAALVGRLDEAARIAPTPWVTAVGARCSGLLAAALGDLDTAAAELERALVAHEPLPMPFERARTLLAKGRLHRRRKEKRLADETLRAALMAFEALGAPVWAELARAELGRVGLRPRASDHLTDTERRVAELAASGLTAREIAERAFLAPKTVGNVLGRVYQKLGIHSRAELGALIASEIAPGLEARIERSDATMGSTEGRTPR